MKTVKDHLLMFENINDKDVSIFENITEVPDGNIQVGSYVAIICTSGKAFCKQNGIEINIGKNDFLLSHPNTFVDNIMVNLDFKCKGMVMSPTYFEAIFFVDGNYWDLDVAIKRTPVIHLEDEEAENLLFDLSVLKKNSSKQSCPTTHSSSSICCNRYSSNFTTICHLTFSCLTRSTDFHRPKPSSSVLSKCSRANVPPNETCNTTPTNSASPPNICRPFARSKVERRPPNSSTVLQSTISAICLPRQTRVSRRLRPKPDLTICRSLGNM